MIYYSDGTTAVDLPNNAEQANMILRCAGGGLSLGDYPYRLPDTLVEIETATILTGYDHPLPNSLLEVRGFRNKEKYKLPMPLRLMDLGE